MCEPVSAWQFPKSREICREILRLAGKSALRGSENANLDRASRQISLRYGAGNFCCGAGNLHGPIRETSVAAARVWASDAQRMQ